MLKKLSIVTIAKNEEANIAACINSAKGWADEHIVVDDFSSDRTVEIAKSNGAAVFQRKMDIEGVHRNWAYQRAKNEWVLSLDADEEVTPELKEEIMRAIQSDEYVVYNIPLRTYIGNYWVQHGGWYPGRKDRLFKKSEFKYEEAGVHPRVFYKGRCGRLKSDIIHKGYKDFAELFRGLNGQTTLEAEKWFNDGRKVCAGLILWKATDRFFRTYIWKKGCRDGLVGFVVAMNSALYQIFSYVKYRELKNRLPGCGRRRMKEIDKIDGHFGLNEGYLVFNIAKSLKDNSVILEIGAFKGKSTCFIAEGIRAKNCKFYTIDPWSNHGMEGGKQDIFNDFLKNTEFYKNKITSLRGYSHDMRKNWPEDRKIDFLWIDGDHSYKGVTQDIQDWLPLVKKNGFVCFHDYRDEPDVKKAVDEITNNKMIRFVKTEGCIYMARRN